MTDQVPQPALSEIPPPPPPPSGPPVDEPSPSVASELNPVAFARRPDWRRIEAPSTSFLVRGVLFLFVVGLVGAVLLGLAQAWAADTAGAENELESTLDDLSALAQVLLVVVFAPIAEELAYRFPLMSRLKWPAVALGIVLAGGFFFFPLLFLLVPFGIVMANEPARDAMKRLWIERPAIPIWGSIAVFGLTHLVNFDISWDAQAVLLAPLLVGPQVWLGLIFTVSRVRMRFSTGLIQHALHNGAVWTLLYLPDVESASIGLG